MASPSDALAERDMHIKKRETYISARERERDTYQRERERDIHISERHIYQRELNVGKPSAHLSIRRKICKKRKKRKTCLGKPSAHLRNRRRIWILELLARRRYRGGLMCVCVCVCVCGLCVCVCVCVCVCRRARALSQTLNPKPLQS